MKNCIKRAVTIFAIFGLLSGTVPSNLAFANSVSLKNADALRAMASLIEHDIYEIDSTGCIKIDSEVTIAQGIKALIELKGYSVPDLQSGHWFDRYYGTAVANGLITQGEFDDFDSPLTRAEFVQLYYRSGLQLPTNNEIFNDIGKNMTWKEAASILQTELINMNQESLSKNVYMPQNYSIDDIWSVDEFDRFMSDEYKHENSKYVMDYKYIDGGWKLNNQSLSNLESKYTYEESEYIRGKVYNIMRRLLWNIRKNEDFVQTDYDIDTGVVAIKIYTDSDFTADINPALKVEFVPKNTGGQSAINEAAFEIYLAHLYDMNEKLDNETMSRGEFNKFIKVAKYQEEDFTEYLDIIAFELFNGKEDNLVKRMKDSYYEVKTDLDVELELLSKVGGKRIAEWDTAPNGERVYGFKARISENLK